MMRVNEQYCIDKTSGLEKGIDLFPSIYIEGAAGSGKTTAVNMLLDKHPEVQSVILEMKSYCEEERFYAELEKIKLQMKTQIVWTVFEDIPKEISEIIIEKMVEFVENLPEKCRVIFVGRERPDEKLLHLLWKRKMDLFPVEMLLFRGEEIQKLIDAYESSLNAEEIFTETGGWAGCVDLMIRLSVNGRDVRELRESYEISTYIQKEIIETLSEKEQEVLGWAEACPWLNKEIVTEVFEAPDAVEILKALERKGLVQFNRVKKRWKIGLLFRNKVSRERTQHFWEQLGVWYETHGFLKEALFCLEHLDDNKRYRECMLKNYTKIPALECSFDVVMSWEDISPECVYLRGKHCYLHRDFDGLRREIQKLNSINGMREREIFLNLSYMDPEVTLDEWLGLLEKYCDGKQKIRLYHILGNSHTAVCGMRDLSGLFIGGNKEENRKARLWREHLGEEEWLIYQLAKIDYYMETMRSSHISQEEWDVLEKYSDEEAWQIRFTKLYLCSKLQNAGQMEKNEERMHRLEMSLLSEESEICIKNTISLVCLYSYNQKKSDKLARWLRYTDTNLSVAVTEENYIIFGCQIKGYLLLNQYKKAERILRRLIPYLKEYKRSRFLAEALFQQSIIKWKEKKRSLALQNVIESFLVNGTSRYVTFYAGYGKQGVEVIEAYVEWFSSSWPEMWGKKKKYNYGNVLRMPWPDYMDFVLRYIRRVERKNPAMAERIVEERLTMMETIVLQNIGLGLTNAEICKELNLKMTTVKSHVYSLYKKLGVNSRVQAVLKGKELGMIEE